MKGERTWASQADGAADGTRSAERSSIGFGSKRLRAPFDDASSHHHVISLNWDILPVRRPAQGEAPLYWVGSSKRDLLAFPEAVKDEVGTALSVAQFGGKHPAAKPWKGEGAGILEVVEDHDGDTYRAVYTVRFRGAVYVLHCFQKKSHKGTQTPKPDVELVSQRLKLARRDHEERYGKVKHGR